MPDRLPAGAGHDAASFAVRLKYHEPGTREGWGFWVQGWGFTVEGVGLIVRVETWGLRWGPLCSGA